MKRMSGTSLGSCISNDRQESHSASVVAGSFDLEVNTSLLDDSVDSTGGEMLLVRGDFTTNEIIHVNRWSYSLKVGGYILLFTFQCL